MNARRLRLAVIGCGPIGWLHAESIRQLPQAELVAVCDIQFSRAELLATSLGVPPFADHRQLLASQALDAVTVATPNHLHATVALDAIAAGCHVFCEKPLASSLQDAVAMVEQAERRGVALSVNYNRRFGFGYRKAMELMRGGRIGTLEYAAVRVTDRRPSPDVARNPHIILTTLLSHHIDLLRWLGGEITHVSAMFGPLDSQGLVHSVSLCLRLEEDKVAAIVAGYRDGQTRTDERTELAGTAGQIAVVDVTRRVEWTGLDSDHTELFLPNHFQSGDRFYQSLSEHIRQFVQQLVAGERPEVTGRDGVRGIQVAEAALESSRCGRLVEVP